MIIRNAEKKSVIEIIILLSTYFSVEQRKLERKSKFPIKESKIFGGSCPKIRGTGFLPP